MRLGRAQSFPTLQHEAWVCLMRLVLLGDAQSPHLLKWARALAPRLELWAASSRGFLPEFDDVIPPSRRLALQTSPRFEGGNAALLRCLPRLVAWLRPIQADWLHAHYLTSHGTLAWLAQRLGVRARLVGSAWGSDILVTPQRGAPWRWLTRRVLAACELTTSDSHFMAERMRELGAREVMVFPFGLEALPTVTDPKEDGLFFANRGLEDIYNPFRVLEVFAHLSQAWPQARLVVAHDGALRVPMEEKVRAMGLSDRVRFTGRLDAVSQSTLYGRARWYLSLPRSDSVSVSVLEAMAHGCIPLLSDLPANRELVTHGENGWILAEGASPSMDELKPLAARGDVVGQHNRQWVGEHALFPKAVDQFVQRLVQLQSGGSIPPR